MQKVCLVDHGMNKVYKHIGFSFGYLFLGPFYLLCRLDFWGLLLIIVYAWLLPIWGMEELLNYFTSLGASGNFYDGIKAVLLFFHTPLAYTPNPYIGIILCLILHLTLSFKADNRFLKRTMKRKSLYPFLEEDARILIYYRVAKKDVALAADVARAEHRFDQAEQVWEDKNLTFTTMLTRADILKAEEKIPADVLSKEERHKRNADLLEKGVINKDQYELLEKRGSTSTKTKV